MLLIPMRNWSDFSPGLDARVASHGNTHKTNMRWQHSREVQMASVTIATQHVKMCSEARHVRNGITTCGWLVGFRDTFGAHAHLQKINPQCHISAL